MRRFLLLAPFLALALLILPGQVYYGGIPVQHDHVATNAELALATRAAYPNGVTRDDFAAGNNARPLFYKPNASACSLNAGAGDNGSQVPASGGGCWLASFPAPGPVVSDFGSDNTGVADASTALQSCLNAAALGIARSCAKDPWAIIRVTSDVTIPQATTLDCQQTLGDLSPSAYTGAPGIRLSATKSLKFAGTAAAIRNCFVLPDGMTFPQTVSAAWAGTAINTQGNTAPLVENTMIFGFDKCINAYGSARSTFARIRCDANGGQNTATLGSIETGNSGDADSFYDVRLQVYATGATCPARERQGIGWYAHGAGAAGAWVNAVTIQDYQTAQIKIDGYNNVVFGDVWLDYDSGDGCARGTSVGLILNNSQDFKSGQLNLNGMQTGLQITNQPANTSVYIADLFLNSIGQDAVALGASGNAAGFVHINNIRTNTSGTIGRYAVNYIDTTGATTLQIDGGVLLAVNGSAAPYINVPGTVLAHHVKLGDNIRTDLADNSAILGTRGLGTCTGLGSTGTCALVATTRSNPFTGVVQLNVAGSGPGSTGVVPLNAWPLTLSNSGACLLTPIQGSAGWPTINSLVMQSLSATQSQIAWTTATALTAAFNYLIKFDCQPQ